MAHVGLPGCGPPAMGLNSDARCYQNFCGQGWPKALLKAGCEAALMDGPSTLKSLSHGSQEGSTGNLVGSGALLPDSRLNDVLRSTSPAWVPQGLGSHRPSIRAASFCS